MESVSSMMIHIRPFLVTVALVNLILVFNTNVMVASMTVTTKDVTTQSWNIITVTHQNNVTLSFNVGLSSVMQFWNHVSTVTQAWNNSSSGTQSRNNSSSVTQSRNNSSSVKVESVNNIVEETSTSANLNDGKQTTTISITIPTRRRFYESSYTNVTCAGDKATLTQTSHPSSQTNMSTNLCDSSSAIGPTEPLPYTAYWQHQTRVNIFKYGSPILLVVGNIGNLLSVITLMGPAFRSSSTSFILTTLAVMDTGVIDTGLVRLSILTLFGVDIRLLSEFSCKVHMFLTYYFHHLSSWTLILLTAERVMSVYFPLRCKQLCSKRRTVAVWIIIAVILLAINSNIFVTVGLIYPKSTATSARTLSTTLTTIPGQSQSTGIRAEIPHDNSITFNPMMTYNWTSSINHFDGQNLSEIINGNWTSVKIPQMFDTIASTVGLDIVQTIKVDNGEKPAPAVSFRFQCSPYQSMRWFFDYSWYWMDAFLGDFIPFGVVFLGNVAIVKRIIGAQNKRADQMHVVAKNGGKVASTTTMLIFVGLLFLVLTLPSDIYYLGYTYDAFPLNNNQDDATASLVYAVTSLLYFSNSAFNFLFYFISGQKFRTAFCAVICCGRRSEGGTSRGVNKSNGNGRQTCASGATNSEMSVTL